MECNKEEASRAKDLAVVKLQEADYAGAKRIALKAQKLFPGLENISQLLAVCEVHCCAAVKINGETDWYGILQVEATADDILLKKQYHKLALLLHPDKNKFVGAEAAFKLIGEAHMILTDKVNRLRHNSKWNPVIPKSAPKQRRRPSKKTGYANKENTDAGYSNFWTICLTCGTKYQYPYTFWLEVLWCQMCSKHFVAYDLSKKPFVGVEALNPFSGFAMQHEMLPPSQWTHVANQQRNYQSVPTRLNPITGHPIAVPNPQQQPNVSGEQTPDINQQQRSQKFPFCSGLENVVNSHPWDGSGMQQEVCPLSQPTHLSDQKPYYQRAPGQQNPVSGHQTQHSHPWGGSGMQQEMCPLSQATHVSDQKLYYQMTSGQQNPVNGHQTPHSHPWGGYGMQQEMCPPSQPTMLPHLYSLRQWIHAANQQHNYKSIPTQQNPTTGHQAPVPNQQQQPQNVSGKHTPDINQQQQSQNVVNSHPWDGSGMQQEMCPSQPTHASDQKLYYQRAPGQQNPVNGHQTPVTDCQHPCTESQQRNNVIVEDGSDGCGKVSDHLPDSPAKKRIRKDHSSYTGGKCDHTTGNEVAEANSQHKCSIPCKEKVTNEKEVISGLNVLQGTKGKLQNTSPGSGNNAAARSVNNCSPFNVTVSSPDLDFYNFEKNRDADRFTVDQIWALYDDLDGMPRYYARIKQVYSPNFMLELTRLEHDPLCDAEKEWSSKELPVACGNFRVGRTLLTEDTKMFSHVVSWTKGSKMNRYEIYPKKGEIWALFRGWDIKWISHSNDHRHYDYDIVEITSDFAMGLGTYVIPLVKIKGFVSLFVRSSNKAPFLIPSGNTLSFSHSIPFHRLAETDRQHIPNGALKLDTASLPSDLEKTFTPMNIDRSSMSTRDGDTQCHLRSTSSCQVPVGKTKQSQDGTGTNVKDDVEKLNQNSKIKPWFLRREGKTWRVTHSRATPRRA